MRSRPIRSLACLCVLVSVAVAQSGAGQQRPYSFRAELARSVQTQYLLYLPPEYESAAEKVWPLLLFLHGAGERGSDLELVKKHGPPKIVESRPLPFIVVSPQVPAGEVWSADALRALLVHLMDSLRVDRERVYVTGLSMGGFGAWDVAAAYPDLFTAVVPISGGGNPSGVCRLGTIPVWVVHGAADDVIPAVWSDVMVRRLRSCGGNVRLTIHPGVGHDAWTRTYEDPALYDWLLAQRRERH